MILVDTSVWVDHFSHPDPVLANLLNAEEILAHRFVIGELTMGSQPKPNLIGLLFQLDEAGMATDQEVRHFVARHKLHGVGIGYLDAHLLASTRMTPDTILWTRDKRLAAAAATLSINYVPRPN
jgi:predicted nucleic acid-binding protein